MTEAAQPSWRPSPDQALLLRAALLPDERAREAWQAWRRATAAPSPVDDRLLPLAVHRLGAAVDPRDEMVRRGLMLRQRARLGSLLLVHHAARIVRALEAAGVATLVLKGAALALRYYKDLGLRPMDDLDVLVHPDDVPRALALLHAEGFAPTEDIPPAAWPPRAGPAVNGANNLARMAVTHACGFAAGDHQLDLHWAALATNCAPDADQRFWASAVPLTLGAGADQAATRALAPEHELVHALVHGLRWNGHASIRWIADAVTIMRAAPLDWARVEDEVARRGVAADAATALELLGDYAAPIPADVAPRLRRLPERRVDRWRQAHNHWPWDRPKPPAVIAFDAWRFVEGQPLARALPVLGRYAWLRMAPDGKLASVPRQLFEKIIRPRL